MTPSASHSFPSEEDLREGLARLSERARPRDDCPPASDIWRAAMGEAIAEETQSLVLHTSGCPACMEAWRLAREIGRRPAESASSGPTISPTRSRASRRGMWLSGLAAAAAVILAAGVMLYVRPKPQEPPTLREGSEQAIQSLVPDGEKLPRAEFRLKWSGPASAARFHLRVMTEHLQPITSVSDLSSSEHLVPAEAFKGIDPGTPILWQVEASLPDGHTITSRTFRVLVE